MHSVVFTEAVVVVDLGRVRWVLVVDLSGRQKESLSTDATYKYTLCKPCTLSIGFGIGSLALKRE